MKASLTCKDQESSQPLPGDETVAKEDDRGEDCEELPGGGDDRAGERAKVTHTQEDKKLIINRM